MAEYTEASNYTFSEGRRDWQVDQITTQSALNNNDMGILGQYDAVYGYPRTLFWVIHILAIISLSLSIVASVFVILYNIRQRAIHVQGSNLSHRKKVLPFWRWPIGERLVVYLAVCDLTFSIFHLADHSFIVSQKNYVTNVACSVFGFVVSTSFILQALFVLFTAINAALLICFNKKVDLGNRDWKLFVVIFSVPLSFGVVGLIIGWYGREGTWCLVDLRKSSGPIIQLVFCACNTLVFLLCAAAYGWMWLKLRRLANSAASSGPKYQRTIRVMLVFVLVFLIQWAPGATQAMWKIFKVPPWPLMLATVIMSNGGGVLNFVAYTVIRKHYTGTIS